MRSFALLLLLASLAYAGDPAGPDLASRFPAGATAYIEVRGLAGTVDALWESSLGEAVRAHPAYAEFLASPEGKKVFLGQAMLQGVTGLDVRGVLRALAGDRVAVAAYGVPPKVLAVARVDAAAAQRLLGGAELISRQPREEVLPAADGRPALWKLGPAFVVLEGDVLAIGADRELVAQVRDGSAAGLADAVAEARALAAEGSEIVGFLDLEAYGAKLRKGGKPKDLGQALLLGALAHSLPAAPWAAFSLDLAQEGDAWRLTLQGRVPATEVPDSVRASFGGTLQELPFALPGNTLGVIRMRRSLEAVWSHRDDLIAERGIPGLVEFETNFGNLTGGMSWVEQFLPSLRNEEFVLVATRRTWPEGAAAPAIRAPQGAILFPLEASEDMALRLQIAFHTAIGIVNATQGMMGTPFVPGGETYKGVEIQTARYMPPPKGEMEGRAKLPLRYNLEPSAALVGDWYVLASTKDALKEIIDARDGATPAPAGVNAGLWLRPKEIVRSLAENREPLIAQTMLKDGLPREEAEKRIDLVLDLARYVKDASFAAEEGRADAGLRLDLVLEAPGGAPSPAASPSAAAAGR